MICERCGQEIGETDGLSVDLNSNTLRVKQGEQTHEVQMSPQEAELAFVLLSAQPAVVGHDELMKNLWPSQKKPQQPRFVLRYYVTRLRHYLRPFGYGVVSVFNQGYRIAREPH